MRLVLIAAAFLAAASQQPVFRVDVRLVRILATVKDAAGGLVASLNKEDFTVYDNGMPQELAVFERRTELPLSIALLVDTSLSTAKELRYELDSVERFLGAVFSEGRPEDAVALYSFNYGITLVSGFTRNRARLREGLKRLRPEGGTSLYDAIYLAARDLEMREGRRVMILVTDGGDTTSAKTFHDALEAAHLADAVIYAILVMPITSDAGRNIGGENALEGLAAGTGGRVFRPQLGSALDEAFAQILSELRTQYLLAYYPKNVPPAKDRFHRVEVRVSKPDLRVLARSGYYEESEHGPRKRR
ncbi:MAG TPA: VWA domain-containing protein [Bryobacteraceae bacterium]|nr:VWA domain-containing protein [Bryobacteraceae bacterium]